MSQIEADSGGITAELSPENAGARIEARASHHAHPRSSFAGDVLRVVFGASSAQLFSIIAAPLLTRMYSPEAFGLMAVYTSLVGVVGVMVGLRYEQAILLPEHDEDAGNVLALALAITIGISAVLGLVTALGAGPIFRYLGASRLIPIAWIVPVSILLTGLYQSITMWNSRMRQFGAVSGSRALSSAISNSGQLGCGYIGWRGGGSLIGSAFAGNLLALLMVTISAWRRSWQMLVTSVRWRGISRAARRYMEFPLYNSWGVLLNTLSWQLPALLLARYFGSASAGYFSIGMRVLSIPMDVIALSIGQVLFQRAAEAYSNGTLPAIVEPAVRRLFALSTFPILLLGAVAPELFALVFGVRWRTGGVYLEILAPWICIWFMASPLSVLINVLGRQKFGLALNATIFVTRVLSLFLGHWMGSVFWALAIYSATGVLVYGWLSFALIRGSGVRIRSFSGVMVRGILLAVGGISICAAARFLGAGELARLLIAGSMVAVYLGFVLKQDKTVRHLLKLKFGI